MKQAIAMREAPEEGELCYGMAALVRRIYEGKNISQISEKLLSRVSAGQADAAAFMDLSVILRALGQKEKAEQAQKAALEISRTFEVRNGAGTGLRVLALVTPGDFMANTPIEFLLEASDATLLLHYIDAGTPNLKDVSPHDVAFVAIGESDDHIPVLENLERLLRNWRGPILNNAPRRIVELSRDGVAQTLAAEPNIVAPATCRLAREMLGELSEGRIDIAGLLGGHGYPIIVRPLGTHAGHGMEKIAGPAELGAYLAHRPEAQFFISPFIDYAGPDGKYRKQRIAFINSRPFPSHLAVSDHWVVHYLSAGMAHHADRRAEEAAWMESFDSDFAVRHAEAFAVLARRIGLDYFAIDCSELADGRLLVFEADIAMIVHSMDSAVTFPYKKGAMTRLFDAFEAALRARVTDPPGER
jgi:hypothetical protein